MDLDLSSGSGLLTGGAQATVLIGIERLYFRGGSGNDSITGAPGRADAKLTGLAMPENSLFGYAGDDILHGSDGVDILVGGTGRDLLSGFGGADLLEGRPEHDTLIGRTGDDTLEGDRGKDRLNGGAGLDVLTGGRGADVFLFRTAPVAGEWDRITDFAPGQDMISLRAEAFTGLDKGVLAEGVLAIAAGGVAQEADDRILYDSATGALYWDADGAGGADAVQFAAVQAGLALTAADFVFF